MNISYQTQSELLLKNILSFYENKDNIQEMLKIITGESKISLRIVDWFVTNYSKKYFTNYVIKKTNGENFRFKVYIDYKLKLKAYSKRGFDSFCRWERIKLPYGNESFIETTLGQCNFFAWCIKNNILTYINDHFNDIEDDMMKRNSTSKKKEITIDGVTVNSGKTRKKRQELSISATKTIHIEEVEVELCFN